LGLLSTHFLLRGSQENVVCVIGLTWVGLQF
jgi:hypothetical protein